VTSHGFNRRQWLQSLLGSAALLPLSGCRRPSGRFVVGFSQMDSGGAWRIAETNSMRQAAAERSADLELVVTDAQDQTAKQIADVEDLIARRVGALFIAPRDYEGLEPTLESARHARVPVFLIDRQAEGTPGADYVSFLGSDFITQGRRAALWLAGHTQGSTRIVELSGTPGSSVARDRAQGFRIGMADHDRLRIIASQTANFSRSAARAVMSNLLQALGDEVTAVFAHNDEMALGAIQAIRAAGLQPGAAVVLVSIDGQRAALQAILAGELGASVESNPRFGPLAFATLERYRAGENVPARILLEDRLFDARNARAFLDEAY
jgi:ribose transport system substrate-binding protein